MHYHYHFNPTTKGLSQEYIWQSKPCAQLALCDVSHHIVVLFCYVFSLRPPDKLRLILTQRFIGLQRRLQATWRSGASETTGETNNEIKNKGVLGLLIIIYARVASLGSMNIKTAFKKGIGRWAGLHKILVFSFIQVRLDADHNIVKNSICS